MSASTVDTIVKEITIRASAERVFDAVADPLQRVQWWGAPGKFQATEMQSDLRPGGAWLMGGTGMGGNPFTLPGEYRSVERPRVLEFTWLKDGDEDESVTLVRFEFIESGGVTTVRLTHSGLTTDRLRQSYQGWPWLLALLQAHV